MNVVLVSQLFPPETAAGANRVGAMARALAAAFELEVVTIEPSYPDPRLFRRATWEREDVERGIAIRRAPAFKPHEASLIRRALREIGLSVRLVRDARPRRGDVLLVSTPSMFLAPLAWWRARASKARFAWDVRDLTWRYARESVATSGSTRALLALVERLMLAVLRRTDLVVAATPGLGEVLLEQGVSRDRMITVSNGVSREWLERFAAPGAGPRSGRPRVTYVGLMGYNHGIGVLLDVARRLPEVDLALVGDGPERPAIEARLAREPLANVTLHGYVTDPQELVRLYQASDVLVNHTQDAAILNRIVNPAKLFEYFATGRPVVYAGAGFAARFLTQRDLARVVPPQDPDALAAGIREVLADPARARERSARARATVEREFCRESQMEALVEAFRARFAAPAAAPPAQ